ncbi:G-protein coupled receptor 54-like [Glandiceps talaboti]
MEANGSFMNTSINNETSASSVDMFLMIIVPVIFGIITLISVVGNGLVIFIVIKYPNMHNVTNFYILNVALSDLVFVVVCAPITSTLYIFPDNWIFGDFMCRLVAYIQYVSVQATCATLTAMTVDRYYVISQPMRSRHERTPKLAIIVCVFIWIGSFALHIPLAMYFGEVYFECQGETKVICFEMFPSLLASKIYQAYSLVVLYLLPLAVIGVCYGFILKQVWRIKGLGILDGGVYEVKQSLQRRRKVTRMVLIVVMLFAISWGPLQAMNSWARFDPNMESKYDIHLIRFRTFCLCLAYSNSCINPFIYALTGNTFQKYFKRLFRISDERNRLSRFRTTTVGLSRHSDRKNYIEKTQDTSM